MNFTEISSKPDMESMTGKLESTTNTMQKSIDDTNKRINKLTSVYDILGERVGKVSDEIIHSQTIMRGEMHEVKYNLQNEFSHKFSNFHSEFFGNLSALDSRLSCDVAEVKQQMRTMIKLQEYTHKNKKFNILKKIFKCNEGKNHTFITELHHTGFVEVKRCTVCGEIEINILD